MSERKFSDEGVTDAATVDEAEEIVELATVETVSLGCEDRVLLAKRESL